MCKDVCTNIFITNIHSWKEWFAKPWIIFCLNFILPLSQKHPYKSLCLYSKGQHLKLLWFQWNETSALASSPGSGPFQLCDVQRAF